MGLPVSVPIEAEDVGDFPPRPVVSMLAVPCMGTASSRR